MSKDQESCGGVIRSEDVQKVLTLAAEIVEHGWVQYRFAADRSGKSVNIFSNTATCFCANGAIGKAAASTVISSPEGQGCPEVYGHYHSRLWDAAADALKKTIARRSIHDWNDHAQQEKHRVVFGLLAAAESVKEEQEEQEEQTCPPST